MRSIQKYLWIIERVNLRLLIAIILAIYILIALVFGSIYYMGGFVSAGAISVWDHLYFSFITQSTVGYGDLHPVSWGKLLVVIQTVTALFLFAIGTGFIVLRMLTPQRNAIDFDNSLMFYPDQRRFRFKFVNRLPIDLYMGNIEMRLRKYRTTDSGQKKRIRKTVELLRPTITRINSMRPLLSSALAVEELRSEDVFEIGKKIRLEPSHLDPDSEIYVIITAQCFVGVTIAEKEWSFNDIYCGEFKDTYNEDSLKTNWKNWNNITTSPPDKCLECDFAPKCPLKGRQS